MVGRVEKGDARSVKKFRRSEPGQLLNLAVTKRMKGARFNEVTNTVLRQAPPAGSRARKSQNCASHPYSCLSFSLFLVTTRAKVARASRGITKQIAQTVRKITVGSRKHRTLAQSTILRDAMIRLLPVGKFFLRYHRFPEDYMRGEARRSEARRHETRGKL